MTDKFLDLRHRVHYSLRFSRSEGVNGFHKTDEGIIKFVGTTPNAVNNELDFRDVIYNLVRINTIKRRRILTLKTLNYHYFFFSYIILIGF